MTGDRGQIVRARLQRGTFPSLEACDAWVAVSDPTFGLFEPAMRPVPGTNAGRAPGWEGITRGAPKRGRIPLGEMFLDWSMGRVHIYMSTDGRVAWSSCFVEMVQGLLPMPPTEPDDTCTREGVLHLPEPVLFRTSRNREGLSGLGLDGGERWSAQRRRFVAKYDSQKGLRGFETWWLVPAENEEKKYGV